MCGIAGSLKIVTNINEQDEVAFIKNILQQQDYRGPDHQNIISNKTPRLLATLGHNRLSIVDPSPTSNQPMWDEQQRFCIVYNGMLYNYLELRTELKSKGYSFTSVGDTEVVLKAFMCWGVEAFQRFNGMFAIAIFDNQEEQLYLIRDRLGIKPLFYLSFENEFYFASTSHQLAASLKLQPNMQEIATGLRYWAYGLDGSSVYQDLFSVKPCEVLTVKLSGHLKIKNGEYYSLTNQVLTLTEEVSQTNVTQLQDKVSDILQDAVKLRLRSDVPLGISLSGGLDSALVSAIARQHVPELNAFSYGSLEDSFTESKLTALSAKHTKVNLHFVYPIKEERIKAFWQTLSLQDAPFPNFSIVAQYLVFKEAKEHNIKVMLGGQGSDEIFMGYRKYLFFYLKELVRSANYGRSMHFLSQLLPTITSEFSRLPTYWKSINRYFSSSDNTRWESYCDNINLGVTKEETGSRDQVAGRREDQLWQRQLQDLQKFSLPALLRYEDRNSMGNSIESRLPFLDYRLVELALSLPTTMKLNKGFGKWVLREIATSKVPRQIAQSRIKRGFDVDTRIWIESGLGQSLREAVKSDQELLNRMQLQNQVDKLFTNEALIKKPERLAEGISLAWLATKSHFVW